MEMDRILVTGATGFVGRPLVKALAVRGHELVVASRAGRSPDPHADSLRVVEIGDIGPGTDWSAALDGCSAVVHLAARTPARGVDPEIYRRVNDIGTARLAEQAGAAGVRLFVLMSSLHAVTAGGAAEVIDDRTEPRPVSPYAVSKLAAEGHAEKLGKQGIAAVTLRPPLVIGTEAVGHWRQLQKLAASGLPLPVGALRAARSVISVDNLVDAVARVIASGAPASGRYLLADPEPVSLAEMVHLLRRGMNLPPRTFALPEPLISGALTLLGRGAMASSLFGRMELDGSRFRQVFNWSPPLTTAQGIVKSGREFLQPRN